MRDVRRLAEVNCLLGCHGFLPTDGSSLIEGVSTYFVVMVAIEHR